MLCTNCGQQTADESVFCTNCGFKLLQVNTVKAEPIIENDQAVKAAEPDEEIPLSDPADLTFNEGDQLVESAEISGEKPLFPPEALESAAVPSVVPAAEPPLKVSEAVVRPASLTAAAAEPSTGPAAEPAPISTVPTTPPAEKKVFCTQCGKPLAANALFCIHCGKNVVQTAGRQNPPIQANPQGYTRSATAGQPGFVQPTIPQPGYAPPAGRSSPAAGYPQQNSYNQAYAGQPPYQAQAPVRKKSKKGLVVTLIILAIVLAGGFLVWNFAGRDIKRMVLGTKKSYVAIEAKQLKADAAELAGNLLDVAGTGSSQTKGGRVIDAQFSFDGSLLGLDATTEAALENIKLESTYMYDRSEDQPIFFNALSFKANEESLLTLETFMKDQNLIVTVPEILEQSLLIEQDAMEQAVGGADAGLEAQSALSMAGQLMSFSLDMEQKDLEKSFNKIIDITLDHMDEAAFEKKTDLTAAGVTAAYDCYTVSTTGEKAQAMVEEILKTLRDDPNFYELFHQVAAMNAGYADTVEMTREEWTTALDDSLTQLQASPEQVQGLTITQKIYVDGKDVIHGRDLLVVDADGTTVLNYINYQPVEHDRQAVLISLETNGSTVSWTNEFTAEDDLKTGNFTLASDGAAILTGSYENYAQVTLGEEEMITGSFTLNPVVQDATTTIPQILFTGEVVDERYAIGLTIGNVLDLKMGYRIMDEGDVQFPTYSEDTLIKMTDSAALQGLMTEDTMQKLMSIAAAFGFPLDAMVE